MPVNCSAYFPPPDDLGESSACRPAPSRTCDCLTQTLSCHGCGNPIGYTIVTPVSVGLPCPTAFLTLLPVHTVYILNKLIEPRHKWPSLRFPLERNSGHRTALRAQRAGGHALRANRVHSTTHRRPFSEREPLPLTAPRHPFVPVPSAPCPPLYPTNLAVRVPSYSTTRIHLSPLPTRVPPHTRTLRVRFSQRWLHASLSPSVPPSQGIPPSRPLTLFSIGTLISRFVSRKHPTRPCRLRIPGIRP